mgnify:FL=1|jgi:hypothetical protein
MKIFFYKSLLIFFLFLIAFHFSFNYVVKQVKINIENNFSKEKIEDIKNKLRNEMQVAVTKDDFISKEDAELINKFLNKIKTDLNK